MAGKSKLLLISTIILMTVFFFKFRGQAEIPLKENLNSIINGSGLSKTAIISISVRRAESESVVYERHPDLLLHPASTLKAFTTPVMLKYLGINGEIITGLYKYKDDFYLKLSGDPLLTEKELLSMFENLKAKGVNRIQTVLFTDDSAIDNIPWGIGWMWDDENNPYMPKFNSYNLDNNLVKVKVSPGRKNLPANVSIEPDFPLKVINTAVTTSDKTDISIERPFWVDPEFIYIKGEIASSVQKTFPVASPEKFFIYRLKSVIKNAGIGFSGNIKKARVPTGAVLVEKISHGVIDEISHINRKSNNLAAETLLKLTGGKFSGKTGTTKDGLKAFRQFYKELGIDTDKLFIVDGSGVSHNDLISTGWMSLALCKLYKQPEFEIYKNSLARPGTDGTLDKRFKGLPGRLWAKTGTLAGISGITGYIKADSGKVYTFALLIQNYKGSSAAAKNLEDKIVKNLIK